jgi:tetratricopeptide (TPR) repeat protein
MSESVRRKLEWLDEDNQDDSPSALAWARDLLASGRQEEAEAELERAAGTLAAIGLYREAMQLNAERLRLRPEDVGIHQVQVEYAVRNGERQTLLAALLLLADCLARVGSRGKAIAVYQRILSIDPTNSAAREGVRRAEGRARDSESANLETRFVTQAPRTGNEAMDFAEVLAEFRAQLGKVVTAEDAASHFDLGLAFREMGLFDEAISEFQTALRGGGDPLKSHEELGYCHLLKGQFDIAEKILSRALELPVEDPRSLVGIHYHLAECQQELGQAERARESLARVVAIDPRFRDAADRLARL